MTVMTEAYVAAPEALHTPASEEAKNEVGKEQQKPRNEIKEEKEEEK